MSENPKPRKATKATVARRIEEILQVRLQGAMHHEILRYIAEKEQAGEEPWTIPEGGKPLAERTIWWYSRRADQLLEQTFRNERSRKRVWRRHLAQRRFLYASAINQGDIKAALAVLRDEAELRGLYPARKTQLTGKNGGPVVLHVTEEIIGQDKPAALDGIVEEVVTSHDDANSPSPEEDPPPSCPEGIPAI